MEVGKSWLPFVRATSYSGDSRGGLKKNKAPLSASVTTRRMNAASMSSCLNRELEMITRRRATVIERKCATRWRRCAFSFHNGSDYFRTNLKFQRENTLESASSSPSPSERLPFLRHKRRGPRARISLASFREPDFRFHRSASSRHQHDVGRSSSHTRSGQPPVCCYQQTRDAKQWSGPTLSCELSSCFWCCPRQEVAARGSWRWASDDNSIS